MEQELLLRYAIKELTITIGSSELFQYQLLYVTLPAFEMTTKAWKIHDKQMALQKTAFNEISIIGAALQIKPAF